MNRKLEETIHWEPYQSTDDAWKTKDAQIAGDDVGEPGDKELVVVAVVVGDVVVVDGKDSSSGIRWVAGVIHRPDRRENGVMYRAISRGSPPTSPFPPNALPPFPSPPSDQLDPFPSPCICLRDSGPGPDTDPDPC